MHLQIALAELSNSDSGLKICLYVTQQILPTNLGKDASHNWHIILDGLGEMDNFDKLLINHGRTSLLLIYGFVRTAVYNNNTAIFCQIFGKNIEHRFYAKVHACLILY